MARIAEAEPRHLRLPEEKTTFVWQGMRLTLELTDEKGELSWSGKYGAWGRINRQNARDIRENAWRPFDQPLRYAGQYITPKPERRPEHKAIALCRYWLPLLLFPHFASDTAA